MKVENKMYQHHGNRSKFKWINRIDNNKLFFFFHFKPNEQYEKPLTFKFKNFHTPFSCFIFYFCALKRVWVIFFNTFLTLISFTVFFFCSFARLACFLSLSLFLCVSFNSFSFSKLFLLLLLVVLLLNM